MTTLITGVAGFIGFHTTLKKLSEGEQVIGIDNLNDYYDVNLKETRLEKLKTHSNFKFLKIDITDKAAINKLFSLHAFDCVIHLAAQAGVRYSLENPHAYIDANLVGFCNILEGCRHYDVKHLIYASTSSVYGANGTQPFSESHSTEHPMTLYAATKKANEMMAHSYASLYGLPCTGLRFFTVYGPWGRPDMALFLFTKNMLENKPINVFNNGNMVRDFTYVEDIVEGICCASKTPATTNEGWQAENPDPATSYAPYRIYNIGNNKPVKLMAYIEAIETRLGVKAKLNMMPMQLGDVPATCADVSKLETATDYKPKVDVTEGVAKFVDWYRTYYNI